MTAVQLLLVSANLWSSGLPPFVSRGQADHALFGPCAWVYLTHEPAFTHYDDTIRDGEQFGQLRGDEKDGRPLSGQGIDALVNLAAC